MLKYWYGIQQTPEWFELHNGKFTSTDSQAVGATGRQALKSIADGKTPKIQSGLKTVVEKVFDGHLGFAEHYEGNKYTEKGNETEAQSRMIYEMITGNIVTEIGFIYDTESPIGDSPDGLIGDDGILEIKWFNRKKIYRFFESIVDLKNDSEKYKKIESKYRWQIQWHLWVTSRKWCDFVCYNDDLDHIEIIRVLPDLQDFECFEHGVKMGLDELDNLINAWSKNKRGQK